MTQPYAGFGATRAGQSQQVNRTYKTMAADLKRKGVQSPDCDQPQSLEQALRLIASLQNQLADAQALIDDMRAQGSQDITSDVTGAKTQYWDSKRMARESGVAVCTICRNAKDLGGIKLGGDWLFLAGTTYGKKRK